MKSKRKLTSFFLSIALFTSSSTTLLISSQNKIIANQQNIRINHLLRDSSIIPISLILAKKNKINPFTIINDFFKIKDNNEDIAIIHNNSNKVSDTTYIDHERTYENFAKYWLSSSNMEAAEELFKYETKENTEKLLSDQKISQNISTFWIAFLYIIGLTNEQLEKHGKTLLITEEVVNFFSTHVRNYITDTPPLLSDLFSLNSSDLHDSKSNLLKRISSYINSFPRYVYSNSKNDLSDIINKNLTWKNDTLALDSEGISHSLSQILNDAFQLNKWELNTVLLFIILLFTFLSFLSYQIPNSHPTSKNILTLDFIEIAKKIQNTSLLASTIEKMLSSNLTNAIEIRKFGKINLPTLFKIDPSLLKKLSSEFALKIKKFILSNQTARAIFKNNKEKFFLPFLTNAETEQIFNSSKIKEFLNNPDKKKWKKVITHLTTVNQNQKSWWDKLRNIFSHKNFFHFLENAISSRPNSWLSVYASEIQHNLEKNYYHFLPTANNLEISKKKNLTWKPNLFTNEWWREKKKENNKIYKINSISSKITGKWWNQVNFEYSLSSSFSSEKYKVKFTAINDGGEYHLILDHLERIQQL